MYSSADDNVQQPEEAVRVVPLLRNRDYLLLWGGQTISLVGSGISQFAFPLLVLALTASPLAAGIAGAFNSLPYIILSLPAGALIDRWDRKRVMVICDTVRMINIASIPLAFLLFGQSSLLQIYLVSLIEGSFFTFFNIAETACLPRVVAKEQLPAATAQSEVTYGLSVLISPSLGGLFYSIGQLFPFLADAISYAASVFSLLFIRTAFQGERVATPLRLRQEISEGLIWLWRQPLIRYMAFLTGGINLFSAGIVLVVVVIAQHQGASPAMIGVIFAIAGIGTVLGSLLGGVVQRRFSFGLVIIGSCLLLTLLWPLYIIIPNSLLLGAITASLYIVIPIYNVVQFSYRLALIPDEMQGRVNSVFRLLAFGFMPLGFALTGILLQNFGVLTTVIVATTGFLLLTLLTWGNAAVREARPLAELES